MSFDHRKLFKMANKIIFYMILPMLPNTSHFQLCSLFRKNIENKIASINDIMRASTTTILNPTIYIAYPIDSYSIFTIFSIYEINYLLMNTHFTSSTNPFLSHYITYVNPYILFFFAYYITNLLNYRYVSTTSILT